MSLKQVDRMLVSQQLDHFVVVDGLHADPLMKKSEQEIVKIILHFRGSNFELLFLCYVLKTRS